MASAALNPTQLTFKVKDKNNKIQSCSIRFKVSVDAHEVTSGLREYKRHCISRIQKDISKCHFSVELTKKDKKTNKDISYKSTRGYTYRFNVEERQHVHSSPCYDDANYPIKITVYQSDSSVPIKVPKTGL